MNALLQQLRFRNTVSRVLLFWCMLGLAAAVPSQARAQPQPATLNICKQTIPPGSGTGFNFTGANSWTPPTTPPGKDFTSLYPPNPFPLQDGACRTLTILPGNDSYNTITEAVPPGWALTNIFCNHQKSVVSIVGGNPNPGFQFGDDKVTIDQTEPNVTCTFVNTACFKYGSDSLPPCTRPGEIVSLNLSTVDKTIGGVDPNWTVSPGGPNPTSGSLSPSWTAVPSNWVVPNGTDATYTYTRYFNLPCRPGSYQRLQLSGEFAADNTGKAYLNGNLLASCPTAPNTSPTCFQTPATGTSLASNPSYFNQGINQLTVVVGNESGSVTGVSVKAEVSAICGTGCICGCPPGSVMQRNGRCGPQTATLEVRKVVVPDPGVGSSTSYPIQVTCSPSGGGPVVLQGSSSTTMSNLGIGSSCTVQEPPPVVPAGCSGVSVQYAPAQPMTLVAGLNVVTVTNRYTCGNGNCAPGTMRQGASCVRACRSPFVPNAARTACG
ncbi:MAG: DUF5979 domain-containing protein, partial [Xanthobacteraceae bacterium]